LEVPSVALKASILRVCDVPVRQIIKRLRLESALARIQNGDKIDAVMLQVGWRNRTTFFREFQAAFGHLPSECRLVADSAVQLMEPRIKRRQAKDE
jgi:AraC-like DNA-binding protein